MVGLSPNCPVSAAGAGGVGNAVTSLALNPVTPPTPAAAASRVGPHGAGSASAAKCHWSCAATGTRPVPSRAEQRQPVPGLGARAGGLLLP